MSTLQTLNDPLEHGDLGALICVDDPAVQEIVIEQLSQLGFRFHTALYPEEVSLRLRSRTYEIVVVGENFGGTPISENLALEELSRLPLNQRRHSLVVLIGPGMESRSEMQAFLYSVELTLREDELPGLKGTVGRAILRKEDFYSPFNGVQQSLRNQAVS